MGRKAKQVKKLRRHAKPATAHRQRRKTKPTGSWRNALTADQRKQLRMSEPPRERTTRKKDTQSVESAERPNDEQPKSSKRSKQVRHDASRVAESLSLLAEERCPQCNTMSLRDPSGRCLIPDFDDYGMHEDYLGARFPCIALEEHREIAMIATGRDLPEVGDPSLPRLIRESLEDIRLVYDD